VTTVVTIGNFDGVHRGHRALVERATTEAARRGLRCVALTFDPHPAAVLRPDAVPPALQSLAERVTQLRALGCDDVDVVTFDADLAAMTPERFVSELLVARLAPGHVVVGENFRFGRGASGDVAVLRTLGEQHGFSVEAVGLVALDGQGDDVVSSSALRAGLAAGDLEAVARGLGRPYTLAGEVVAGDGRGRTIGVPTANVAVDPGRALPADGVYACWASTASGRTDPAVVNVGWRPTFAGTTRTVEAHLLVDDAPDLYGRTLTLAFVTRIRGEERFDGPEALVARIGEDIVAARRALAAAQRP
jgi:riboflavin kinase / FMN adenylyltransferase